LVLRSNLIWVFNFASYVTKKVVGDNCVFRAPLHTIINLFDNLSIFFIGKMKRHGRNKKNILNIFGSQIPFLIGFTYLILFVKLPENFFSIFHWFIDDSVFNII
jgi:hypothetical protein